MSSGSGELGLPSITSDQMREVDRLMVEKYGILLIQMMENAGRGLAHLARFRFLAGDPRGRRVLVLAGTGGNGGGGLVCARRLHGWGAEVRVCTTALADRFTEVSRHQLAILERMNVPLVVADNGGGGAAGRRDSGCPYRVQPARLPQRRLGSPDPKCQ